MVAKSFEVGDLVWAKMKGYSPWPGQIIDPPSAEKSKVKKSHHYVLFYGSDNHAWIADENILLHEKRLVDLYTQKKKISALFQGAVDKIVEVSKNDSKYQKSYESFEKRLNDVASFKFQKHEGGFKKHSFKDSSAKNASKMKRKVPVKKITLLNKRKRTSFSKQSEAESSTGFSIPPQTQWDDGYKNLFANIPPNIGYNGGTAPSTVGLLSIGTYVERPETPPLDLESENILLKEKRIKPTSKKIGFLGLGKLGQGIVKNLIQSGHSVTVWNRTTEKCSRFLSIGAEGASTPADVVTASDITFCCVADTEAAKTLVYGNCGVLKGLETCNGESKGYVEMTSMDPKSSHAIATEVERKGGRYLEAPINGSRVQAIEGTLLILGAGDRSLFDECESCFQAIARHTIFLSPNVGSASKYNVVHSMLVGAVYAALAESLALVKRTNLDEIEFLNILQYGVLDSKEIFEKGKAMVKNEYTSNTPLKHVQKDINLGLLLGGYCEQPMPIFAAANEAYKHLKLLRYSDHDVSAIYEGTKR